MLLESYSAKEVLVNLYSHNITGVAAGDFLAINWVDDNYNFRGCVSGDSSISRSGTNRGTVTLVLLQHSLSNSFLESIYMTSRDSAKDLMNSTMNKALTIKDLNTGDEILAPLAYITKHTGVKLGKQASTVTWTLSCPTLFKVPTKFTKEVKALLEAYNQ